MLAVGLPALVLGVLRSPQSPFSVSSESEPQPQRQWVVEVTGAVRKAGIYTFKHPPTRRQVIDQAGRILTTPSTPFMSRDQGLQSGARVEMKVSSQTLYDPHLSQMDARKKLVLGIPIDVNSVGTQELALVPGISKGLALRIIGQRESRGAFKTWHDLRMVKGLGPMRIKGLQRYLQLGAPPTSSAPASDAETP